MYVLFGYNRILFLFLVSQVELSHFYNQSEWILGIKFLAPPSTNVMPIPLTLYKCLGRGLKLCILSAYNP